jgi:hypothetical protein
MGGFLNPSASSSLGVVLDHKNKGKKQSKAIFFVFIFFDVYEFLLKERKK